MAAPYGRRIRRGAAGTVVAVAAMAALTASQAPGLVTAAQGTETVTPPPGPPIDGGSPYITDLPPLTTPGEPGASIDLPAGGAGGTDVTGGSGLPTTVLTAYKNAESAIAASNPGCHLRWELLAAIGQVESNHARNGNVDAEGTTLTPILGPVLNGVGFANISDTDDGAYDGDTAYDRAVGPMQFIPSTWAVWGADGNGDGTEDPNNIYDAALAAGHYLCAGGRDLSVPAELDRAILGYNHSQDYLHTVKSWYEHFLDGGAVEIPDSSGTGSGAGTGGVTPGPTGSPSPTTSPSASPSATGKPVPTVTATGSVSPSTTPPVSPGTTGPTPTDTTSPTGTASPTPTPNPTCPTPTPTPTGTPTSTTTPTPSTTTTPTSTTTPTPSTTTTPTSTTTPTGTPSTTDTPTPAPCAAATASTSTPTPTASASTTDSGRAG